jgi:hypothetical protein
MARIRSTARLTNESGEVEATEIAPISEVMKDFGIVAHREEENTPKKLLMAKFILMRIMPKKMPTSI